MNNSRKKQIRSVGFLLSQVGGLAASRFAELLRPLEITPSHAGILRLVAQTEGLSQKELCDRLSILPSRLVVLIDELEGKQLLRRADDPSDRRSYALRLTPKGANVMSSLREIAQRHHEEMCKGLTADETKILTELLNKIASAHNLVPGIHPGYKRLGRGD
jgi:DNA-binding MarR family transcriptional regulator